MRRVLLELRWRRRRLRRRPLAGIGVDPPRVALVDIGLPGLNGIDGVRILRERYPSIAAVLLTVFKDDDRIFRAICAGACGSCSRKRRRPACWRL